MIARASHRFARIGPLKARVVVDQVRGKSVDEALSILQFSNKRASVFVRKVLDSAIANATHEHDVDSTDLFIQTASVDDGPRLKRFRPRAQGRAYGILKRMCHIAITLGSRVGVEESEE